MLLTRISTRGPGQMPPLASSLLDTQAIVLVSAWITNDLAGYQSFAEWQVARFGSTTNVNASANADPDLDGARNFLEWLTGTNPQMGGDAWTNGVSRSAQSVKILIPQIANRGFEVQRAADLSVPVSWQPLDIFANRPFYSVTNRPHVVEDALTNGPGQFYRVRVFEP
jgi:hypothetical protein